MTVHGLPSWSCGTSDWNDGEDISPTVALTLFSFTSYPAPTCPSHRWKVHHLKLLWAAIIVNHSQIHREITWLLMTSFKVFHIPYQSTRAFVCNLPCKSTQTTWKSPGKLQSPQLGLAAEAKSGSLKHPIWPGCPAKRWDMVGWFVEELVSKRVIDLCPLSFHFQYLSISDNSTLFSAYLRTSLAS